MKVRSSCLCCQNKKLEKIINLGKHSFADRFIKLKNIRKKDPVYPLVVDKCRLCSYIQLRYVTKPEQRYSEVDYSYTSSNSAYSRNHWDTFCEKVHHYVKKKKFKKILEIGSNDGYLSINFKKKKYTIICVDASKFMINLSKKKKLISEHLIFNYVNSKKLKKKYGKQELIIANNVFNHSDQPSSFLKGIKNIINKNGIFIFEQPYFSKSIIDFKFDQIYHEHISYFTIKNLNNLLKKNGFKIIKLDQNEYHGGSIRIYATLSENLIQELNLSKILKKENMTGVNNTIFYKKFMNIIENKKKEINKKINNYIEKKYIICGIGAAAKANTLLSYFQLNHNKLNFITDNSKYKINKYTPLTRIEILNDNIIKGFDKIACIILAWNIRGLLKKKIYKINNKVKFLDI